MKQGENEWETIRIETVVNSILLQEPSDEQRPLFHKIPTTTRAK